MFRTQSNTVQFRLLHGHQVFDLAVCTRVCLGRCQLLAGLRVERLRGCMTVPARKFDKVFGGLKPRAIVPLACETL